MKKLRERFETMDRQEVVSTVIRDFINFYKGKSYSLLPSMPITSGVDPTVRFIGSPINLIKPYLLNSDVPSTGICAFQECVRTHNLNNLFNTSYSPNWGSFFPGMCAVNLYEESDSMSQSSISYFTDQLSLDISDLLIRAKSDDTVLDPILTQYSDLGIAIEFDTKAEGYYRHIYGNDRLDGVNFNVAIKDNQDEFNDVGNIIVMYLDGEPSYWEFAVGATSIAKEIAGLDHILDLNVAGSFFEGIESRRILQDTIITSCRLVSEGLIPNASHNRNRILRSYIKAIYLHAKYHNVEMDIVREAIELEANQYSNSDFIVKTITEFLSEYDHLISKGKGESKEDKLISRKLYES